MGRRVRSRFLGDPDAASDPRFAEHYIDSSEIERLVTPRSDVIYGSKGVGKTALRRALTELRRDYYYATTTIDLDSLSFAQLHNALENLRKTSYTEVPSLARTIWRNALALYALEAARETLGDASGLGQRITSLLATEGFTGSTSNNRLLALVERVFRLVGQVGLEGTNEDVLPLALNRQRLDLASRFPITDELASLLEETTEIVIHGGGGRPVLVCVDGLDSIVDHTPESRTAVFAGLIDAVFKCARDARLSRLMSVKAFLPEELTDEARAKVWDSDKQLLHTHHIRWTEDEFQRFLLTRLAPLASTKSRNFVDIWSEFMPDKVWNLTHAVEENTFTYILRHTLYRPRQLLTHMQNILNQWDDGHEPFRVDPTFIPGVVASTNYDMAEAVATQLEVKHAGISGFLQSWAGTPNTIPMTDFQDRIRRVLGCDTVLEQRAVLTDMYNAGIFGTSSSGRVKRGNKRMPVIFGFVGGRRRNITPERGDLVTLSPMFHEYCECASSEYGVILPVGR